MREGVRALVIDPAAGQYLPLSAAISSEPTDLVLAEVTFVGAATLAGLPRGNRPAVIACGILPLTLSSPDCAPYARSATVADAVSEADTVLFAVWLDTEKELISQLSQALVDKVVIDPSNPIGPDGQGGFTSTLPEGESAASVLANLLPAGAHFVKAFGSLGAEALGSAVNRPSARAVLFYATDDDTAAETAERLISASGFDSVKVGGIEAAGRIELMRGDLHQHGGLGRKLLNADEARAAL